MCIEILKLYKWFNIMIIYVIYDQIEVLMMVSWIVVLKDGDIM